MNFLPQAFESYHLTDTHTYRQTQPQLGLNHCASRVVDDIAFYCRTDHPRMRAFSYAWPLPVTW